MHAGTQQSQRSINHLAIHIHATDGRQDRSRAPGGHGFHRRQDGPLAAGGSSGVRSEDSGRAARLEGNTSVPGRAEDLLYHGIGQHLLANLAAPEHHELRTGQFLKSHRAACMES